MQNRYIIIFTTTSSREEGARIISALINKRLIACGNIIKGIESVFRWKGKTVRARESLIIIKTKRALFKKVAREIERLHSYEVPEVIAAPIIEGSRKYLKWIDESVL